MDFEKNLIMGLDIGTSTIKLLLYDILKDEVVLNLNESIADATIKTLDKKFNEQNVDVILDHLTVLFRKVSEYNWNSTKAIQICGQMHGVVLWNTNTKMHSSLVTWQDNRCSEEFLTNLPIKSSSNLNSGYGCATLLWYIISNENQSVFLDEFNAAGTIQDYITFILSKKVTISTHNAFSWGYFDINLIKWEDNLLNYKKFPINILPTIHEPLSKINNSISIFNDRNYLIDIYVALGDLQCSVFSCIENHLDCVINISTSSQICMVVDGNLFKSIMSEIALPSSVTVLPYFHNNILLAATSLNGGNVLEKFIEMIIEWNSDLSILPENFICQNELKQKLWEKLIYHGNAFLKKNEKTQSLTCKPLLFSERHDKSTFASVKNIRIENNSIGEVFSAICQGLIINLKEMFSENLLKKLKCQRIIATGGAILKNEVLKHHLEFEFESIPIIYKITADAAKGAAKTLKNNR